MLWKVCLLCESFHGANNTCTLFHVSVAKVGVVPQDMQDQMTALRTTVDKQFEDLSSVSKRVAGGGGGGGGV